MGPGISNQFSPEVHQYRDIWPGYRYVDISPLHCYTQAMGYIKPMFSRGILALSTMSLLWQGYVSPLYLRIISALFNLVYKPSPGLHQAFIGLYIRHGISLLQCQKELGVWHSVWISPLQESRGISTFYTPVSRAGVHEPDDPWPCPLTFQYSVTSVTRLPSDFFLKVRDFEF